MKIKKNDKVIIMKGKDRGKTGKVLSVLSGEKVVVDGLNVYKKTIRKKTAEGHGDVVTIAKPMSISNVQVVCSSCGKPTRIGYEINGKNGAKTRICKKCKASL